MISPTLSSTSFTAASSALLSPSLAPAAAAFRAYSSVIRHNANTAKLTWVCFSPWAKPPPLAELELDPERAASKGPEIDEPVIDAEEEEPEKGVARSPRTRRRRISSMFSGSEDMCVLRKRWRSVCTPTGEFTDQESRIVQIVGACNIQNSIRLAWSKMKRAAHRIRVNNFDLSLPSIGSISSHPEHSSEHALEPFLHVPRFHPFRLREWTVSV